VFWFARFAVVAKAPLLECQNVRERRLATRDARKFGRETKRERNGEKMET